MDTRIICSSTRIALLAAAVVTASACTYVTNLNTDGGAAAAPANMGPTPVMTATPPANMVGSASCGGQAASAKDTPHAGRAKGDACTSAGDCTQTTCSCTNGNRFFAAECVRGKCDNTDACSCSSSSDGDLCSGVSAPPSTSSCAGNSAASGSSPAGGGASGASCTTSADCAQTTCACNGAASYFAASCVNGTCNNSDACACVGREYQKNFGKDICTPPPAPKVETCTGDADFTLTKPRTGGAAGAACKDASECAQITCYNQCPSNNFFAAGCIDGKCDSSDACACAFNGSRAAGTSLCR